MSRQSQSGGDYSTNVQGSAVTIVQTGLSVEDAKQIAMELMRPELERLTDQAAETAYSRAKEMVEERLLPRLTKVNPGGVETFADPDVQYALIAAQRAYARTGDKDVADVLVDILVDRTKETERNVRQLALNESLEVAAKLTADQFASLSLIWLITYTRNFSISNRDTLRTYIETHLAPHVPNVRKSRATYQHLEYAGCGAVGLGVHRIEDVYGSTYASVFAKGFTANELSATFAGSPPAHLNELLIPCLNDPSRQQFNAADEDNVKRRAAELQLSDTEVQSVVKLFNQQRMNRDEVRSFLLETHSAMEHLLDVWSNSLMQNMTLTSVGITIAHANCRRIMGTSPAELSIWIN